MSKKVTAIVLALYMLLCFAACGSETDSVETATSQSNSNETSEIVPASEPEPDPKTTPEYHFKESGWLLECFDTEEAKAVERGIV